MHAKLTLNVGTALLFLATLNSQLATSFAQPANCCPVGGGFKFAQSPNLNDGIDVDATFLPPDPLGGTTWVLADDFPCTNSGPVTGIILWGSWFNDSLDPNASYTLSIWSDVPTNGASFSHPGVLLWSQTYSNGQHTRCIYTNLLEGFYTPALDSLNHSTNLYQLCFQADPANAFFQTGAPTAPTNYWLSVAVQASTSPARYFGWKSSATAYNDSAVSSGFGRLHPAPEDWRRLNDLEGNPLNFAFAVTTSTNSGLPDCIDLRNAPPGSHPTPWTYKGVSFSATNFDGMPLPAVEIRSLGSFTGLDCGWALEITLANWSCDSIAVTLVSFAEHALLTTYDGSGNALEAQIMSAPQRTPETLGFRGQNVARLVVVAPADETLLLELCCLRENCCPLAGGLKHVQYPDPANGIDVDATFVPPDPLTLRPWVLADDFACTNSGPITDIVLWGSWLDDRVDPNATYTLAIWSDVPTNTANLFSHPGARLWTQTYTNGQYSRCRYTNLLEGFDNARLDSMGSSTNLDQICFQVPPANSFSQTGTPAAPTNYWLSVTVHALAEPAHYFGWKSSATAYNDAAVASDLGTLHPAPGDWFPLHDLHDHRLNLAFAVTTSTNSCPLPVIQCTNREVQCGTAWTNIPPPMLDPCCANPGRATLAGAPVTNGPACAQEIILNWQYTNCQQLAATCVQTIFVRDTTPPIVTCASNKTVECGTAWVFDPPSGHDSCCGATVMIFPTGPPVTNRSACPLIVEQTWAITDCCSNTAYCTQQVTVVNANPPTVICPGNMIVKACGVNPVEVTWALAASAACGSLAGTASSPPSGSAFPPDTTNTVTAWAWTECGVTNSCTFTVTVVGVQSALTITHSGGNITLHWTDGILQEANAVTGPYADVPMAAPPTYTVSAIGAAAFYRLRCGPNLGKRITLNNGPGDQMDPHVSGDLAVYADTGAYTIRYYSFLANIDRAIPKGSTDIDAPADASGTRIAFSRAMSDRQACMVYDTAANTLTEIAPQVGSWRSSTALGRDTVAFTDQGVGNGDIMVYDLATSGPLINVSASPEVDGNPHVAPSGNAIVWQRERCNPSCVDSGVMKSVRVGGMWSPATIVSDTPYLEYDPDTDGVWIVYASERPSATGPDIYFQPLSGGSETRLAIPGTQRNPAISSGVIVFDSLANNPVAASDVYLYIIATGTLLRVTDTPAVNEVLSDIDVLPNGDIRVVWAADDGLGGEFNVYARTFTPP